MSADPYLRLPLGDLQSVLSEDELDQLDFLWRSVVRTASTALPLLSDKRTLALLFRNLTLDRLASREFRKKLVGAMDVAALDRIHEQAKPRAGAVSPDAVRKQIVSAAWVDAPLMRAFVAELGLSLSILPPQDADRAERVNCIPYGLPLRQMLDYQVSVHDRVLERLDVPNVRLILQMPTGSGKTLTAMNIISSFFKARHRYIPTTRVLWLAHAEELCEQAFDSLDTLWRHIGSHPIELIRAWQDFPFPERVERDALVVASFQKAHRALSRCPADWRADLIVVDEAHRAPAPTYQRTLESMRAASGRVVGLTATPGRAMRDREQNSLLADLFGNEIIGVDFDGEDVVETLQRRQILSVLRPDPIDTGLPVEISDAEWRRMARDSDADFTPEFLRDLAMNRQRNQTILRKLIELLANDEQILFFATSVNQSRILTAALLGAGHQVAHIDGSTNPQARLHAVSEFRARRLRMLANYGVFSTGFDAPQTTCVFIARPTTSLVLYSQMLGRGLRGPALGGNPVCRLVQVRDNFTRLPRDLDDIYQFFSDYWRGGPTT